MQHAVQYRTAVVGTSIANDIRSVLKSFHSSTLQLISNHLGRFWVECTMRNGIFFQTTLNRNDHLFAWILVDLNSSFSHWTPSRIWSTFQIFGMIIFPSSSVIVQLTSERYVVAIPPFLCVGFFLSSVPFGGANSGALDWHRNDRPLISAFLQYIFHFLPFLSLYSCFIGLVCWDRP